MAEDFIVIVTAAAAKVEDLQILWKHLAEDGGDNVSLLLSVHQAVSLDADISMTDLQDSCFAGATLDSIEATLLANEGRFSNELQVDAHNVLVLDDDGLQSDSVILLHRNWAKKYCMKDWQEDEPPDHELYQLDWWKTRVPQFTAMNMLIQLSVANLSWEDFCDEQMEEKGWFRFTA